ncbi:MAG: hypothetical protein WDW38_003441 [Sanguina aurantia]
MRWFAFPPVRSGPSASKPITTPATQGVSSSGPAPTPASTSTGKGDKQEQPSQAGTPAASSQSAGDASKVRPNREGKKMKLGKRQRQLKAATEAGQAAIQKRVKRKLGQSTAQAAAGSVQEGGSLAAGKQKGTSAQKRAAKRAGMAKSGSVALEAIPSRKDVLYLLDNRDDPEVDASIKSFLRAQYQSPKAEAPRVADGLELTAKVEKKYYAAQVVEYGLQNVSVPLAWRKEGSMAPVKRYAAQLLALGAQAGFESPAVEVEKRVTEQAQTCETVKELLGRIKHLTSPDYFVALSDALVAAEAETNSTVTTDGSSAGYKKFAEKVKAAATAHKLPWKLLLDSKSTNLDEAAQDKVDVEYAAWQQSAAVADAVSEIDAMSAASTTLLDKHLGKTAEQVRKEQAASLAALIKKVEAAKGAPWAAQFKADLAGLSWYDNAVSANPAVGPRPSA